MHSGRIRRLPWGLIFSLGVMGLLFYWPVVRVLGLAGANWRLDAADGSTIWFTVWQAVLSTAISLGLSLPVAHLLYRRRFLGRAALRALVSVPFVLPVVVVAIGFAAVRRWFESLGLGVGGAEAAGFGQASVQASGEASIPWIIAAHVFFNLAVAVRAVGGVWASLDSEVLEAARLDGARRWDGFWRVQLPQLRGALAAAGALILLYCLGSFATILFLGGGLVHSVETEIFFSTTVYLDLPRTASLAVIQLILGGLVFWLVGLVSARQVAVGVEVQASARVTARDWFSVLVTAATVIALLAPMVAVVAGAFGLGATESLGSQNFANLAGFGARDLLNVSVVEAAANSLRNLLVSLLVGFGGGVFVARALRVRGKSGWQGWFMAPLAVSSVVLGLGYLLGFAEPPLALRESWVAVPLAQALVILPLVIRLVLAGLEAADQNLSEAAAIDGANGWQTWWQIEVPQLRQSLATAAVFAGLAAIGEFGAASLLVYGDQETLSTVLYRLMARPGAENFGMALAAATLMIAVALAAVAALGAIGETERRARRR